ncbi:ANTAR domain-containing protein [Streptomyces sp. SLBN-115]|uniref:ANTAR domain-containing protein n=1 Tax=Streptomyces sp. SLBN-115 TaxID=2768453 RepID=UPI001154AC42|nr:ANTAR domain-containing protein [Streptomyces sp. SLBN-115]TQJ54501.1 ANTAR domain-containing protein [Streptomyces sp. SLBN-115]
MHRTTLLREDYWKLRAEATWGNASAGEDLVALRAENDQLRRALAGRAVIDQARGMMMVLTPCTRETARELLVDISRQCNTKLPAVAAAVVAAWEGKPLSERMQLALRRALRRLHAEDRRCDSPPADERSR